MKAFLRVLSNFMLKHYNVKYFRKFERLGFHVLRVGYRSPVPDTRELLQNKHWWAEETNLDNVNFGKEKQLQLCKEFSKFQNEFEGLPSFSNLQSQGFGPGYGEIEALILHCFIRHFQPQNFIEIGSGTSTFFSSNALSMNLREGVTSHLTCVEPYPYQKLKSISCIEEILEKKVQDVAISFFQKLGNNDILFIDSSHIVKIGNDVNYLILDVLPSLQKGALIHFHDIPFPYLYPYPDFWIFERLAFWQEATLLKAFLINNKAFEIIYCSSWLHFKNPDILKSTFPVYDKSKHFPSSIWIRKIL